MDILEQPVSLLRGVGPKKKEYLKTAGIETLRDLLYYFPREYENRACGFKLRELPHGRRAGTRAVITGGPRTKRIKKGFTITRVPIADDTGRGFAVWFNNPHTAKQLRINEEYDLFGRIERYAEELQIQNPQVIRKAQGFDGYKGNIAPIYSRHGRLTPGDFERIVSTALTVVSGELEEILPRGFRESHNLESIEFCLKNIHFPVDMKSLEKAKYRLVFEELFLLQFGLFLIKKELKDKSGGIAFTEASDEKRFLGALPFSLTGAQNRAWAEIKKDMESRKIMNRLLQGDVGSGKTVIAALALLKAAQNGYQGALMVPTEILAEQHFQVLKKTLSGIDLQIELLTGGCSVSQRQDIYDRVSRGDVDIIVGTHSLIQEGMLFKCLGLVITDEQHRFGVRQRSALAAKGANPDVLVMTATPIPRSLALILYGDMDLSTIDEMPSGRKRVKTYVIGEKERNRAYGFVEEQLKKGHQAYVVCPLIENTDSGNIKSAVHIHHKLENRYCGRYELRLLHGRMDSRDKEEIMRSFKDGRIQLLISTTVIEVGVDVPNANIMVVENAERFGLAQLHQLRGRVGRGDSQAYCILVNGSGVKTAFDRMKVLAKSNDGFFISEKDLQLRGPGDFFGTRQHGLPEFNIARLPRDIEILKRVQLAALELLEHRDFLTETKWHGLMSRVQGILNAILSIADVI